jgi:imidazolonepropionase-like amidohydrolase
MVMRTPAALVALLLCLCGCKTDPDSRSKAIIGAVLIDGAGGPPLSNSVLLIAGDRIAQAGRHGEVPVSNDLAKVDGAGHFVTPELIDIYPRAIQPADARAQLQDAAAHKPAMLHVWTSMAPRQEFDSLMDTARAANLPIAGHPITQADAQALVQGGATVLIGMVADTDRLEPAFVTRLRDLRIVYAPALSSVATDRLETAKRNTKRLFAAGVPIGVATAGGDPIQECELIVQAGIPPLDAIVAATQNGARALRVLDDRGTLREGQRADLLLLSANPGEDIRNLRKLDRRMTRGEWK